MLFYWRKNKEIDNFANTLADEIYSQLPPAMLENQKKAKVKKLARRMDNELHASIVRLREFKNAFKLGVYSKARFHMIFMERLRSHGYPENIVKELNEYLLINVP